MPPEKNYPQRTPKSETKGNAMINRRVVPAQLFPFRTAAEQLADRIMEDIESGELTIGTVLPSRNILWGKYRKQSSLNQRAVAEALYILAFRGYVTLGTEYNNLHRCVVVVPSRHLSERDGHAQDLLTKTAREELPEGTQDDFFPLRWEPVLMNVTDKPEAFAADFAQGRAGDSAQVFHFVDRIWEAKSVIAVHETWVYPYPQLAMAVLDQVTSREPATLRDIEKMVPIEEFDETFTVEIASPDQRGQFLVGSKWVEPFVVVSVYRRAYDVARSLVFGQHSWYRADRFRFRTKGTFDSGATWLPQL